MKPADAPLAHHGRYHPEIPIDYRTPNPHQPPRRRDMNPPRTAGQWADALDEMMRATGRSAGDLISHAYANGQILGVTLNPEHEDADDERAVIVGDGPDGELWVIRYIEQLGHWEPA